MVAVLTSTSREGPRAQEARTLKFGRKPGSDAMLVGTVPKKVVPFSAVASAAAGQGVVPKNIDNPIAQWTKVLGGEKGNTEATLEHWHKKLWGHLAIVVLGRNRM